MNQEDNQNKTNVLLGSLGVSFEKWLPYATGCLISSCLQNQQLQSHNFLPPLYKNLGAGGFRKQLQGMDILGLTCYVWNQNLNEYLSRLFKQENPNGIVIWGGPNIPKERRTLELFADAHTEVDFFINGMGEIAFQELLGTLEKSRISGAPYPSRLIEGATQNLFPENKGNPYLDGVFETILKSDNDLKASFETNRGCPYSCSFCDWGGQSGNRIQAIDIEEVEKVIDYIFSKPSVKEVEILDANFGMFRRDMEIIDLMVHYKKVHGTSPNVSYSGLAKNGSSFLPKIIRTIETELNSKRHQLKLSFQSHSETTLAANQRQNIKNHKLLSLMESLQKDDDREVSSELIIGLPGDTPESFMDTLSQDIALGISNSRAYILSVSENTSIKDPEFIKLHELKFKKIRFPDYFSTWQRNQILGSGRSLPDVQPESFEEHTLVYESRTLGLEQFKKIYSYWWFHHNFFNSGGLSKTLYYLAEQGIGYRQWLDEFLRAADSNAVLSKQLQRVNQIVSTIYGPEPETTCFDFATYTFMSGPLRTVEIEELLKNSESVKDLLVSFFKTRFSSERVSKVMDKEIESWKDYNSTQPNERLGLLARLVDPASRRISL